MAEMEMPPIWPSCLVGGDFPYSAPVGTRTPNLLIRRSVYGSFHLVSLADAT
jgi:hypothetical protein